MDLPQIFGDRAAQETGPLRGLLPAAYCDPAFLDLEWCRWLNRTWLLSGLAQDLPNAGDLTPVPEFGLFLARDKAGAIRAFRNFCRHRGHELVLETRRGCQAIVCPYHGWRYDLEGALKSVSYFAGGAGGFPEGFEPRDHGLHEIRAACWHDWIFVNLDGKAPPLETHLAGLREKLGSIGLTEEALTGLHPFHSLKQGAVTANWKLVMENSLEPYHTPFVHAETGAGIPLGDHYMIEEPNLIGCGVSPEIGDGSALSNGGIAAESRFLVVPPLLVFVVYAGEVVIVHRNLPDRRRPDRTWRSVHLYALGDPPTGKLAADWIEITRRIHLEEDGPVYESLQRARRNMDVEDGGLLSPVWETAIAAFYRRLRAALEDRAG